MRVIPDVNVLLRAVLQPDGPAREILRLLALGPHRLILSRHIVDTAREKLALPRIRKRSQASNELLDYFVEATLEISLHVIPAEGPPIVPGDHEDDIIVYTAVAGRADVICTWDGHFYQPDVLAFCRCRGIRVRRDIDLLEDLRGA